MGPSIALIKIHYAMDIYLDPAHFTYIKIQPTKPLSAQVGTLVRAAIWAHIQNPSESLRSGHEAPAYITLGSADPH